MTDEEKLYRVMKASAEIAYTRQHMGSVDVSHAHQFGYTQRTYSKRQRPSRAKSHAGSATPICTIDYALAIERGKSR